ncbi:MAG: SO2930 family diheme c-type cytochrome [Myxococcota bacterium]
MNAFGKALVLWAVVGAACGDDALGPASQDLGPVPKDAEVVDLESSDTGLADQEAADAGALPDLGPPEPSFASAPVVPRMGRPPRQLSELQLILRGSQGQWIFNDRVVPYTLNAPLFSDFSIKDRAIYVPDGASLQYLDRGVFEFPVGSAILKSFSFAPDLRTPDVGKRVIETRLLIRQEEGWRAYPYLWREDLSDADYFVRGKVQSVDFIDPEGVARSSIYLVPQRNQCLECHGLKDDMDETFVTIIGPSARMLNRDGDFATGPSNQLAQLEALGMLTGLPPLERVDRAFDVTALAATSTRTMSPIDIDRAARDYLDTNCAHCHNPRGIEGITSRLFLNYDAEDLFNLGVCKEPGSAGGAARGRKYDIVPGDPEASIMWYRTATAEVGDMMPLIGRSIGDPVGSALVWAWIEQLDAPPCN